MAERYPDDNKDMPRQQKLAFYAAKIKAVKTSEREARAMDATYQLRMETRKFIKVMPDLDLVAKYPLRERTEEMKEKRHWYRYKIPTEPEDFEVTLQLWDEPEWTERTVLMDVGDLYKLTLDVPSGGEVKLYVLVESGESRRAETSNLHFSVYDVGDAEKAYTIPSEGWETYLLYREDNWRTRKECDARMLFLALGDKDQLGEMTLSDFKELEMGSIKALKDNMVPGTIYRRPTTDEAMLRTWEGEVDELLRMETAASVKQNLETKFQRLTLGGIETLWAGRNKGSKKRCRRRRRNRIQSVKQPRVDRSALEEEGEVEGDIPLSEDQRMGIKKMLEECLHPSQEQIDNDRAVWAAIYQLDELPVGTPVNIPLLGGGGVNVVKTEAEVEKSSPEKSPGGELSFMGDDSSSTFNRSEAEATDPMGEDEADRKIGWSEEECGEGGEGEDSDDILDAIAEEGLPPADSSFNSRPGVNASPEARSPINPLDLPEINFSPVPWPAVRNEDSFVFNDSMEGWNTFLAKHVNESAIINISSEDSAKKSCQGQNGSVLSVDDEDAVPYPSDILDEQGQIRVFSFEKEQDKGGQDS